MRRTALLVAVLVILMVGVVTKAQARMGWETLEGRKPMGVVVAGMDADATALGLTTERIKTIVELRLRQAGIKVVDDPSLALAYLSVGIAAGGAEDSYAAAFVELSFRQLAFLFNTTVSTWSVGSLTKGRPSSYPRLVEEGLNQLLDEFINDWLRANPKE